MTLATVYQAAAFMGPAYWIPAFWVPTGTLIVPRMLPRLAEGLGVSVFASFKAARTAASTP